MGILGTPDSFCKSGKLWQIKDKRGQRTGLEVRPAETTVLTDGPLLGRNTRGKCEGTASTRLCMIEKVRDTRRFAVDL